MFLYDIYHDQEILKAELIPSELVFKNPSLSTRNVRVDLPKKVYAHVAGVDLVRTGERELLRSGRQCSHAFRRILPSRNREIMMRLFPDAFNGQSVSPVGNYPERLLETCAAVAPGGAEDPVVVLLTPGRYNSAYFEHVFLAEQMGIDLVEGVDLFVRDGYVWMRTTQGPVRVDVIYRRLDDDFMDPLPFIQDRCWPFPAFCPWCDRAMLLWRMLWVPAWLTTRLCTSTSRV